MSSIFHQATGVLQQDSGNLQNATGAGNQNLSFGLPIVTDPNPISTTNGGGTHVLIDGSGAGFSIEKIIESWTLSFLNPFIEKITFLFGNISSNAINQSHVDSLNTLLKELEALRIYFDYMSKKGGASIGNSINQHKANAVEFAIKNLIRTFEKVVSKLRVTVNRVSIPFQPMEITKVNSMNLKWRGAKLKGTYTSFMVQQSKPKEDPTDPGTSDPVGPINYDKPNKGDVMPTVLKAGSQNSMLWWIAGGIGAFLLIKKLG